MLVAAQSPIYDRYTNYVRPICSRIAWLFVICIAIYGGFKAGVVAYTQSIETGDGPLLIVFLLMFSTGICALLCLIPREIQFGGILLVIAAAVVSWAVVLITIHTDEPYLYYSNREIRVTTNRHLLAEGERVERGFWTPLSRRVISSNKQEESRFETVELVTADSNQLLSIRFRFTLRSIAKLRKPVQDLLAKTDFETKYARIVIEQLLKEEAIAAAKKHVLVHGSKALGIIPLAEGVFLESIIIDSITNIIG